VATIAQVRRELDQDGCAYGQVSRERAAHLAEAVDRVDRKLTFILGAIGCQLLAFFFTVVWYALQHGGLQ
jgi:hypothetical protein